jgi:MarR family 2-MHQ and catechol resistance regulon transcriptional repressor
MGTHYQGSPVEQRALDLYIKLTRAEGAVSTRGARILEGTDLTLGQFGILETLYHLGPLHQKDISRKLLSSGANVTQLLNKLEKKKLIERRREDEDRRLIRTKLTKQGRKLVVKILPRLGDTMAETMSVLSVNEQDKLARLLKKLA